VLDTFSWDGVRGSIEMQLTHLGSAADFADVEERLKGFLRYGE
jgi:hypothetical protein